MAQDIFLTRDGNKLSAYDAISAEAISGIKSGEIVAVTMRRPRNAKHLNKYWALIGAVFENQGLYADQEHLSDAIKVATGLFDSGRNLDGATFVKPRSISFSAMSQTAFESYYEKAVQVILTKVLPNTNRADLEARVHEILDGNRGGIPWQAA